MATLKKVLGAAINCGFEAQSLVAEAEGPGYTAQGGGEVIETSVVHSGAASLKIPASSVANSGVLWGRDSSVGGTPDLALDTEYRLIFYFRTTGAPSSNQRLAIIFSDAASAVPVGSLRLNTTGKIAILNSSAAVVGTSNAVLSANTWYRIEWRFRVVTGGGANSSTSLWIDGTQEVSSTTANLGSVVPKVIRTGTVGVVDQTFYYDDVFMDDPLYSAVVSEAHTATAGSARSDSASIADAQAKTAGKAVSDTATVTDAQAKSVGKVATDSVTASEAHSASPGVARTDSVTVAEAATKQITKALSDAVTASDARVSTDGLTLGDSISASDSPSTAASYQRSLSDSVTASDAEVGSPGKALSDSVTASDSESAAVGHVEADVASVTDAIQLPGAKTQSLSDSVTVTDSVTTDLISSTPSPGGGGGAWSYVKPVRVPQRHDVVLADAAFVSDDYTTSARYEHRFEDLIVASDDFELIYIEGIPTRQQKRELIAALA